jgi:flagellar motor switch protein FliM
MLQTVTDFDFRRIDQLPQADILDFCNVQQEFAERLATELSGYLRVEFSIKLQDVRQLTWGAYSARLTSPACLMLLRSEAMPGYGVLELGPAFVFTVLEILLGGRTDLVPDTARELTAIEKKLLAPLFRSTQQRLREAWSVEGPNFELESVIGLPSAATGLSQDDPIVLAEFTSKAGGVNGHLCLAVPARFVRQRRQNSDNTVPAVTNLRRPGETGGILARIQAGMVRAETLLTKASIRIGDLAALQPGDVLNLGYAVSAPLSMCVNGAEVYSGFIVPAGDKRAFSIHSTRVKDPNHIV